MTWINPFNPREFPISNMCPLHSGGAYWSIFPPSCTCPKYGPKIQDYSDAARIVDLERKVKDLQKLIDELSDKVVGYSDT